MIGSSVAAPASAEVLGRFMNGIDISAFRECSWQEGRPAENHQVEQEVRTAVEAQLRRLGYSVTPDGADCWLRSHAIRDQAFPVGMLLIEIYEAPSETIAFRGEATGLVNRTPKEILKDVRKSIKKMFKYFPRSAAPPVD
jgi:hypothetical protein